METPPILMLGPIGWLRRNLFSTWGNSLLTVVCLAAIVAVGRSILTWVFEEAKWEVVTRNLRVLTWGRYPASEVWRLGLVLAMVVALAVLSWMAWRRSPSRLRRWALTAWIASPFLIVCALYGLVLPTPATIANNLGYYIFRPDVLVSLGQTWRGPLALTMGAIAAGFTWGLAVRPVWRFLSLLALAAMAALNLAQGLTLKLGIAGLGVPSLVGIGLLAACAWALGRAAGQTEPEPGRPARRIDRRLGDDRARQPRFC